MIQFLIIILLIYILYVIFRRFIYLRPVTAIHVDLDGHFTTVSVKPTGSFFRSFPYPSGLVSVAPDLFVLYLDSPDSERFIKYQEFRFNSSVYIFRFKRHRFISVSYSNRILSDVISKFKFN